MSGNVKTKERPLSRVGRKPVPIPQGVEVRVEYAKVVVKGPKGTLEVPVHPDIKVEVQDGQVVVHRPTPRKFHQALHGLTRTLIANAVTGVVQGYRRSLEVMGVGYRVQKSGDGIVLNVGYSHPVEVHPPPGITLEVEGNRIHVVGIDKQLVGEVAARIRAVRPPNPYKEKGIRYVEEEIHLKPGKAAART